MKEGVPFQGKTPPGLPLTGEEQSTLILHRSIQSPVPASPLSRGDRGGLAFIPYDKNLTAFARENRKHPTAAESKLWFQLLRMQNLSLYKFTRQKPVAEFIVDFYCAELRLAIEIDGDSHAESISYDLQRTQALNKLGISVVRYSNAEVLNNLDGVYDDLSVKITRLKEINGGLT